MTVTYQCEASQLVRIGQLVKMKRYRAVFTENSVRSLIAAGSPRLNARGQIIPANGIFESGAAMRVGRRILIDVAKFESWLRAEAEARLMAQKTAAR